MQVADATSDAGFLAHAPSEREIQRGVEAAEFFERHEQRMEAERANDQATAVLIGAGIAVIILIAVTLFKKR